MENAIYNYELLIIDHERKQNCFDQTFNDDEFHKILEQTCQGAYEDVLQSSLAHRLLGTEEDVAEAADLLSLLSSNVEQYFKSRDSGTELQDQMSVLCIALSCLQLYVQNNWVGPLTDADPFNFLPHKFRDEDKRPSVNTYILSSLSVDGEAVYKLSRHPVYLLLARILLLDCRQHLQHCQTSGWWLLRCLWVQQAILEERSPTLKATIQELITETLSKETLVTEEANNTTMLQFHLEAGYMLYYYYEPSDSKEQFTQARKRASITAQLTGIMGKRTKFQQKELAQLLLKVERNATSAGGEEVNQTELVSVGLTSNDLPKDLALDDDTILNSIKLTNEDDHVVADVSPTEQALLLAMCHEHRRSHEAVGDILREESLAFVNCVLSQRRNWSVLSCALLQRAYWESDSSRRVERSMGQLEELVSQLERPCSRPAERLHLIYASKLPPKWEIQRELGHILVSLGMISAALDTYLVLEMWEDVIKCYKKLGRREKAEDVIRSQLALKETPSLWCYLGDVTEDRQYYQKAWDLSGCRYARAMRSMGLLYLREGEFQNCIECLEKSLKINPLQIGVWFSFGCACMAVDRYEEAAKAFRRCVIIHSDNFEAWNNLATAYIRCGQKPKAFVTLSEALKCEYENWRLWENYMLVGTDVGQFEEVIRAYHRLLDIRQKHTDAQVLGILVRAVNEDIADFKGTPGSKYRDALLELFGRLTAKVTSDADIWRLYAKLLLGGKEEASATIRQRAVQYLQKSHRCLTQDPNWSKDPAKCKEILEHTTLLAKTYLEVSEKCSETTQAVQMLSSAKLSLKGVLTKVKQVHTDPVTKQLLQDLAVPCNDLESVLDTVVSTIERKKGT